MASTKEYSTIGKVVENLRNRFPDLSISKVRFLEDERIVRPNRTPGGYRKFTEQDVNRLELALALQKERYLPLHVIREMLGSMSDEQVAAELSGGAYFGGSSGYGDARKGPVPADEAIAESGLPLDQIKLLEDYGIIGTTRTPEGKFYSANDVELMQLAREMSKYGIEPRHLRMYGTLADREIALFQQIISPISVHKSDDGNRRKSEILDQLADLSNHFKKTLLKKMVDERILGS